MKKTMLAGLLLLLAPGLSETLNAQEFPGLDKSPLDIAYYPSRAAFRAFEKTAEAKKANEPLIRVLYSRPQKEERALFGELIKYGEIWRPGANDSSEILFFTDVVIGRTQLKAGRYSFYVIPQEKEWKVIFNTDLDNWGAYAYHAEHDVASVTVPTGTSDKVTEAFSIVFEKADDGAHMVMGWDKTVARVPIRFL